MKKVLSIVIAVALVACLATTVFAASDVKTVSFGDASDSHTAESTPWLSGTNSVTTTQDVTLGIADPHNDVEDYSVIVEFGKMDFVWTWDKTNITWDETQHQYVAKDSSKDVASWVGDGAIKVTNHSNRDVSVTAYFAGDSKEAKYDSDSIIATIGDGDDYLNVVSDQGGDNTLSSADITGIYGATNVTNAAYTTYAVTVAGNPATITEQDTTTHITIGTITVTLTDDDSSDNDAIDGLYPQTTQATP